MILAREPARKAAPGATRAQAPLTIPLSGRVSVFCRLPGMPAVKPAPKVAARVLTSRV